MNATVCNLDDQRIFLSERIFFPRSDEDLKKSNFVYQLKKELFDVQFRLATVMDENDQLKTKTAVMVNKEMAQEVVDLKAVCQKLKEDKRKETLGLMLEIAMLSESLAQQKVEIDKLKNESDAKDKTIADLQSRVDALNLKSGQQFKMVDQNDKDAQFLSHM